LTRLAEELARELLEAPHLVAEQIEGTEPLLADSNCLIATGSGDSYAAAIAMESSSPAVTAVDPLEAAAGGRLKRYVAEGCVLVALSVGGRTRSVVEAASLYRKLGGRVVAVTAGRSSPLAHVADEAVYMVYGGLAAGIGAVRHLVMLAAAGRLLGVDVWRPRPLGGGNCVWLRSEMHTGCLSGFSAALFTVLKLYEVYGSNVRAERLEQLVHAPIYSVDTVTLYAAPGHCRNKTMEVYGVLRSVGYRVELVEAGANEGIAAAMEHAYRSLECLYEAVVRDGVAEPQYRRHRGLAELTRLIYG